MADQEGSLHVRSLRDVTSLGKYCDASCLHLPPIIHRVPLKSSAAGGECEQMRTTLCKPACSKQPYAARAAGDEMGLSCGVSMRICDVTRGRDEVCRTPWWSAGRNA